MNQNEIELRELALGRKGSVRCSIISLALLAGSVAAMVRLISCAEKTEKQDICTLGIASMVALSSAFLCGGILCLIDSVKLTAEIKRKSPRPLAQEALLLGNPDLVIEMPAFGCRGATAPCGADIFDNS
jgi:hypothetical protein